MKQNIIIDDYVSRTGKYINKTKKAFKYDLSFLELKHVNMMLRIYRINQLCEKHILKWQEQKNNWNNVNYEFSFLQEEIVFHMRRAVDDMISIAWIHKQFDKEVFVSKIEIDSIGRYLNKRNNDFQDFDECREFLDKMNKISNSYKHSVYQTVQVLISSEEPTFYVYNYQSNDTNNDEYEQLYKQSELLEDFEKMLTIYLNIVYEG